MKTVLASASPRRIEMFNKAGYDPVVMPASVSEDLPFEMSPETSTMFLALKKAEHVRRKIESAEASDKVSPYEAHVIVAADTIVYAGGEILGKPVDKDEACRILTGLRNSSHEVITGCCIIKTRPNEPVTKHCFFEKTTVHFGDYSDEEILAYAETDEPYDKAGGYAIQGTFGKYIKATDGDRDNVIGLPFYRIQEFLKT